MAAYTFPLAQALLGNLLPIQTVTWQLMPMQEHSTLGTGEDLSHDLAPMLWEADVALRALLVTEARKVEARLDALDGATHSLYLADPLGWWPARDPGGTIYGASTPALTAIAGNRKELTFSGLPNGLVFTEGDMVSITEGSPSRTGLHRLNGGGTVTGGAIGPLEVRPHVMPWFTTAATVTFARPPAKVKILAGSRTLQHVRANRLRIGFRVRQTLAAG